jgi:hypothetical protein
MMCGGSSPLAGKRLGLVSVDVLMMFGGRNGGAS